MNCIKSALRSILFRIYFNVSKGKRTELLINIMIRMEVLEVTQPPVLQCCNFFWTVRLQEPQRCSPTEEKFVRCAKE